MKEENISIKINAYFQCNSVMLNKRHSYSTNLLCLKEEKASTRPYAVVFHDILNEIEIQNLVNITAPKLTRKRNFKADSSDVKYNYERAKKRKIVHKAVEAWIQAQFLNF